MRLARLLIASLAALASLAATHRTSADLIDLHPSTRVAPGAPVTLADVAKLEGSTVARLAALELARASDSAFTIEAPAIRSKLEAAGAAAGSVRIRGERVVVRPARGASAEPDPSGETPRRGGLLTSRRDTRVIDPSQVTGEGTPLGIICGMFRNAFESERDALRIGVSSSDLERIAPKPGMRYEVTPSGSLRSDFVGIDVVGLHGEKPVSRERVRVSVLLVRDTAVATTPLRRGTTLDAGNSTSETRNLPPSQALRAIAPAAALGATLVRGVDAGKALLEEDLASPIAVRRNDKVVVRRELGSIVIELEATALQDGKVGDTISLRSMVAARGKTSEGAGPSREGRNRNMADDGTFTAEVVAARRAVIR